MVFPTVSKAAEAVIKIVQTGPKSICRCPFSLPAHCVFTAFHCLPLPAHCLFTAFHCVFIAFHRLPLPSLAFSLPFTAFPELVNADVEANID